MNAITTVESNAVATQSQMAGPLANAIQALQAGMSIEQMTGLMELQERFEANEARKAYVAAMAEFKRYPPTIYKDKEVNFGNTHYSHATLGNVTGVIVDALARHGISHRWDTKQEGGKITVTCTLTHSMGHSESTQLEAEPDASGQKNKIQQIASAISYLQRYTLLAASGMAVQDQFDDDGRGTEKKEVPAELLYQARDVAMLGWKAFAAWIKTLTVEQRIALEPEAESLKAAAKKADKQGAQQ